MMIRPIETLLSAYIIGILAEPLWQVSFVFLVSAVTAMLSLGGYETSLGRTKTSYAYFLAAVVLTGVLSTHWHSEINTGNIISLRDKNVVLIGTVSQEPVLNGEKIRYTLRVEDEKINGPFEETLRGKVLVTVNKPSQIYAYGDRLEVAGIPEIPSESGNPGEFNYRKYLERQGVQLVLNKWKESGIRKIGVGEINPFVDFCLNIKNRLKDILYQTMSKEYAGIMEGILFGTMGGIDQQAKDDFAVSGVIHIFSVSGYHVGILIVLFSAIGDFAGLKKGGKTLFLLSVSLFYAVMTGATPPVMRATLMAWIMLFSSYFNLQRDWATSLGITALILLVIDPYSIYNAGFQLSFVATWGLFYLIPAIHKILPDITFLREGLSVTLAAQIAVLPITSYYFNYVSLVSIPANLVIVPLISILMLLGGIGITGGLIWLPFAEVVHISAGIIIELVIKIAHLLAALPFAILDIKQPSMGETALFYIVLCSVVEIVQKADLRLQVRRAWFLYKGWIITGTMIFIAIILWVGIIFPTEKGFQVVFLSIGQGDSALIESPGGNQILIDTGGAYKREPGSFDPGEKILLPYLIREGIDDIELLVLTHPHLDHYGGADALIGKIKVKQIMIGPRFMEEPDGARMIEEFIAQGTEIREIRGGETIVFDETIVLEMINTASAKDTNVNNGSLMTRVGYGNFHLMFTGDAEQPVLDELAGKEQNLESQIVKVPHHGSPNAWSDGFYDAVHPEVAVISVGEHNNFGHPAKVILEHLKEREIHILRTDQQGAITITSDGNSYEYTTGKEMNQLGF